MTMDRYCSSRHTPNSRVSSASRAGPHGVVKIQMLLASVPRIATPQSVPRATIRPSTTYPTMPLADVMNLRSGDYGGPMADTYPQMAGGQCSNHRPDTCHEYIERIATDMAENGWNGPPVLIEYLYLMNGHHRINAANIAGIQHIPYTDMWHLSEDSESWG